MNDSGWNMYVFRDGRKSVRGTYLKDELQRRLGQLTACASEDQLMGAFIAAGELECALADAGDRRSPAPAITDAVGELLLKGGPFDRGRILPILSGISVPESLSISVAEGFAYYALHPFRFQAPVAQLQTDRPVRILGIRSIGTSLSAVVRAFFAQSNPDVQRITIRPHGHPYDRKLELSPEQKEWIHASPHALFVVVDEGPGLSGSSFLSVAEAVEACGIPVSQIALIGSRYPDLTQMRAPNATTRWPHFRFLAADEAPIIPQNACIDLTGGMWRQFFCKDRAEQPAAWTQLEPAKYMSADRRILYKFHGYGHFGEQIAQRSQLAADAGFAPAWLGMERGFGKYEVVKGALLSPADLTPELIERAAEYCAFRVREMRAENDGPSDLQAMAAWNWQCEFGSELKNMHLAVERLVIADARMQPHEWLRTEDGRILKLDGSTHGDDHFFPGPCDIAWDLAGMIVEWDMADAQKEQFLNLYCERSADDASARIDDYILAYTTFRMGWSKMAARASAGWGDESLLLRDYERYRAQAMRIHGDSRPVLAGERSGAAGLQPAVAI